MAVSMNPFFPTHRKIADAGFQLICLPYAGGGAHAYRIWETKLAPSIEVGAVELPGRGRRFSEKAHQQLSTLLPPLVEAIGSVLDGRPFALFGHSMGALLAFEVAHRLHRAGARLPSILFLSASGTRVRDDNIHTLPDDRFVAKLRSYSGTTGEIIDDPEMVEVFVPILRADFALSMASSDQRTTDPLPIPIEALGGADDPHVPVSDLSSWAARTTSQFRSTVFSGGHFYQREQQDAVFALVRSRLKATAANSAVTGGASL
jgi:medium-chain acyl-[acyl-carrier-protein] hydrolase